MQDKSGEWQETQEWLDALAMVMATSGPERVQSLLATLGDATNHDMLSEYACQTAYCNTISEEQTPVYPGDESLEQEIRTWVRWNAMAMVVRAQHQDSSLGGHIGSFASSATLYDVGFHHFWRAPTEQAAGDLIFYQGHISPGIYARSFLHGDLSEAQLHHFRQEVDGEGLSSYPHPWLMPNYWSFPTVSMGLGPLQAIYQARFMKYLQARERIAPSDRQVWCFCGDGEMDEVESLGALTVAARENLDNLIFVINCNLQRLDGPVRGNGQIIQELERVFKGAGWQVIKVVWGRQWDVLLKADHDGALLKRMAEVADGDYQAYKAKGGAYTREHFFGDALKDRVAHLSDEEIESLKRGGHDPRKIYAAYQAAINSDKPTVILAKTVKGYGLGAAGEAKNTAHNTKKLDHDELKTFRDRFKLPLSDKSLKDIPFYRPESSHPALQYLQSQREQLGGTLPQRRDDLAPALPAPALSQFQPLLAGSNGREMSTTMAFVRVLGQLLKDKKIAEAVVPIVPDEARTFGMEGLFRQVGIYAPEGQRYTPVDADQLMFYKEATNGQILQEGINEGGAFASWLAAATSHVNHQCVSIPFYIFYSMFGFQRIGDMAWAAGDSRARGFLIGGTAGRTTLNGEGLQHQDGHSHLLAGTIPNCETYDPTFSFELAVIIQHGLHRMLDKQEDVFYYITTMNENYEHPAMPEGVEADIIKGLWCYQQPKKMTKTTPCVHLLGSGTILLEVIEAAKRIKEDFGVAAFIWSATSFNALARDMNACERAHRLGAKTAPTLSHVTQCLSQHKAPVIAATDYNRLYAEQIRAAVPTSYTVLGTDGFGRSDTRAKLRGHFEVNAQHIAFAAIKALVADGQCTEQQLEQARERYDIHDDQPNPWQH